MNIVLTGFMASGKTTVGKKIAELAGYRFIDTDEMIIKREGRSINKIFADSGEEYFRSVEQSVIREAAELDGAVIATGGGAVLNGANIDALRKNGVVFNLAPDFAVIKRRMGFAAATRPLMRGQSFDDVKKRYDERGQFYDNCDHKIRITLSSSPEATARKILKLMNI